MSYFSTKQALITKLIDLAVVDNSDIAFDNSNFDPDGKSLWLSASFVPATSESIGKNSTASDEQRGFLQVSVFIASDSGNYDNIQLQKVDEIREGFSHGTSLVYNGQEVDIIQTSVGNGRSVDSWFVRDITINYLTFSER